MIKTLNPYYNTSRTAEIMSRYRPIAPKPEVPGNPMVDDNNSPCLSEKIRQSPYLRNLWPQMQARPTRTRKRGRAPLSPPLLKRPRTTHFINALSSPSLVTSPATNLSLQGFSHPPFPAQPPLNCGFDTPTTTHSSLVTTLPLLPCPQSIHELNCMEPKFIDLNTTPEEKDLLKQLQGPPKSTVIAPQPVRPIGSSISVGCISDNQGLTQAVQVPKKPEEVEEEVESEALPAVISDSNHKVRLANSAYKEMVGQPECSWLDSMVCGEGKLRGSPCKRISGEVMLDFTGSDSRVPVSSKGFSCWVRIEWANEGKRSSVNAFCDVIRLSCESKDYLFTWRFHTNTTREASQSSSTV